MRTRGLVGMGVLWATMATLTTWVAMSSTEIVGLEELRARLGLRSLSAKGEGIRVAILDKGFGAGAPLPENSTLISSYSDEFLGKVGLPVGLGANPLSTEDHGRVMAAIVSGLAPKSEILLLNANGMTNLRRAVAYAIHENVDIILYSQVWTTPGNFDGTGFVNAIVDQAIQADILWINAAGNFGGQVFNHPIEVGRDDWVRLPDSCFENLNDENLIKVEASWNDWAEVEDDQTDKDLDIYVYQGDEAKGAGERVQVGDREGARTKHPRESFSVRLDRGRYCLKAKARTQNFDPDQDQLRLTITSPILGSVILENPSPNSIMTPADHPDVLTVGADLPEASFSQTKPDVIMPESFVSLTNGIRSQGTSNAAALLAGVMAVLASDKPTYWGDLIEGMPRFGYVKNPRNRPLFTRGMGGRWVVQARSGRSTVITGKPLTQIRHFPQLQKLIQENPNTPFRCYLAEGGSFTQHRYHSRVGRLESFCYPVTKPARLPNDQGRRWVEVRNSGRVFGQEGPRVWTPSSIR